VACGSFLLVVVTVQLVLHQEDEDEDEHRGHDDPTDDDDHGTAQELKKREKNMQTFRRVCSSVLVSQDIRF